MKKNLIYAVLAVVLASCSNEQVTSPSSQGNVTLGLSGNVGVITKGDDNVKLDPDTQVAVYAWQTTGAATTLATTALANTLYTVDAAGAFGSQAPIQLFKENTYNACAYAPRKATVNDVTVVGFTHGDDVLYAPANEVKYSVTSPVTASVELPFVHKMAQVKFTLIAGTNSPNLDNVTVKVTGFYNSCTMNLNDGIVTPSTTKTAEINQTQVLPAVLPSVCVVPGAVTLDFELVAEGVTYKVTGHVDNLEEGKSKEYKLTLDKNSTTLNVTGTVAKWIPVTAASIAVPSI